MFRDGRYLDRLRRGELRERLIKSQHPSRTKAREPYCTQSQTIAYDDRGGGKWPLSISIFALMERSERVVGPIRRVCSWVG